MCPIINAVVLFDIKQFGILSEAVVLHDTLQPLVQLLQNRGQADSPSFDYLADVAMCFF